jgi:hypothetical protein
MVRGVIMKPHHLIYPVILFVLGVPGLMRDDVWFWFGVIMWALGFGSSAWIVIGGMWSERANYYDKIDDLITDAKGIDAEKLKALGLFDTVTKIETNKDTTTHYYELPARPVQIKIMAAGVLAGVPFSRRAWSVKRDTFSQGEWFKLQEYCLRNGLIEREGQGYKPSDEFMQKLIEIVSPPLPHQQEQA